MVWRLIVVFACAIKSFSETQLLHVDRTGISGSAKLFDTPDFWFTVLASTFVFVWESTACGRSHEFQTSNYCKYQNATEVAAMTYNGDDDDDAAAVYSFYIRHWKHLCFADLLWPILLKLSSELRMPWWWRGVNGNFRGGWRRRGRGASV